MLPVLAYQSGSTDRSLSEQNQRMSCRTEVRSPDLDFTTVKLAVGFTTERSHLSQVLVCVFPGKELPQVHLPFWG